VKHVKKERRWRGEHLDEVMDGLEVAEVVVVDVDTDAKVEAGVAAVDDLEVAELDKVGVLGVADRHHGVHLLDQLLLLVVVKVHVPLGQPCLTRPVLDQDEPNLPPKENIVFR